MKRLLMDCLFFIIGAALIALMISYVHGAPPQAPPVLESPMPAQAPPVSENCRLCILGEPCTCGLECKCAGVVKPNPTYKSVMASAISQDYIQHAGYWWSLKQDGWYYWNGTRWLRQGESDLQVLPTYQPATNFYRPMMFGGFSAANCGPRG